MKVSEYLEAVLREQTLPGDGQELKDLRAERKNVEALLRREFEECPPNIRYGGSMAKGTMIRVNYDLDLPTYFGRDDTAAGNSLKEIYDNVKVALEKEYNVTPKTSALRLRTKDGKADFHIDVVPGRYGPWKPSGVFVRSDAVVTRLDLARIWREGEPTADLNPVRHLLAQVPGLILASTGRERNSTSALNTPRAA